MSGSALAGRLAVCSWSLRPKDPGDLIAKLEQTGINKVQLALDPLVRDPTWARAREDLRDAGIEVVSGMVACEGEDYSTLESIRITGGIVPDGTWEANWRHFQEVIPVARSLGLELVSFHAGFLPESPEDPAFEKIHDRLRMIAEAYGAVMIDLAFETGQERASALKAFLRRLAAGNVGVNFDPANMILYGMGDPVASVKELMGYLKQVHVKDALATEVPGTWGREVTVGTGGVDWTAFLRVLREGDFTGYLCIEREAGEQRIEDIAEARRFVEAVLDGLSGG